VTDYPVNENTSIEARDLDIVYFKNVAPWWRDLIELAESIGGWTKSTESVPEKGLVRTPKRTSWQISVDGGRDPRFTVMEKAIFDVVAFGLKEYVGRNNHYHITSDEGYVLLRYDEGHFYGEHADSYTNQNVVRALSVLLYLNDDYEGGEIVFPRQGVTIKPEPGSMVIFPSTGTHPHEALKVTKGTKYAIVTWTR
jgi:hypothetical protein